MSVDPRFYELIERLYTGGAYGLYWTPGGDGELALTRWFAVDNIPEVPAAWVTDRNVYFGVNPSNLMRTEHQKTRNGDVSVVNCLYVEFDPKSKAEKRQLLDKARELIYKPAVIVDSGGGLHVYVLLATPFVIADKDDRARISAIQKAWVTWVDGDVTVHDLARVLRVPGTTNWKPEYGPDFPEVKILDFDLSVVHSLEAIEQTLQSTIDRQNRNHSSGAAASTPVDLSEREILDTMFAGRHGDDYRRLWDGDLSVCGGDHSACDQKLCNGLAFYTGCDELRMDTLFRQSGLMRDKWDRDAYRIATLENAIRNTTSTYSGNGNGAGPSPAVQAAQAAIGLGAPATNGAGAQTAAQNTPQSVLFTDLGREYIQRYPDTLYSRGQWYRYGGGVWEPIHELEIDREVWDLLEAHQAGKVKPTVIAVNNIESFVRSRVYLPAENLDNDEHLVNLRNGTYSFELQALLTHDKSRYQTTQLPFDYDVHAACPNWMRYLDTTFIDRQGNPDRDLIAFLQEAVGYSLTTDIRYHKTFWCYGEGANGKGILFHILEQLGGNSAIPFNVDLLHREQYQLADLAGKRIALCPEADANGIVEDALIKALVAGDSLQVRQIRREPFTLKPTVKLWWSMNKLPTVTDTSTGFWRRVVVIPFNADFETKHRHKRIDNLKDILAEELSGIFNWAIEGVIRLQQNGMFTTVAQIEQWTRSYQRESNTILAFTEEECEVDPGYNASSSGLYARYRDWCLSNGYKPYNVRNFKTEMERLGYYWRRTNSQRVFDGLRIQGQGNAIP